MKLPSLDPQKFRSRITKSSDTEGQQASDAGMTFIEVMGVLAIVAVVSLAAVPQINKAMEKANVQNLMSDTQNVAIQVEGDQSLLGGGLYTSAAVIASCNAVKLSPGNFIKVNVPAGGTNYVLTGVHPNVKNYTVTYDSAGEGSKVVKLATPATVTVPATACS